MELHLTSPLDMHLHLREQAMLSLIAPLSATCFAGGVIMPNLVDPVDSGERLDRYRQAIEAACDTRAFTPYLTLFFRNYTREELLAVRDRVIGIKLYPAGITTQSENGVRNMEAAFATIAEMEDLGIPLLVHGESGGFVLDRETEFLEVYRRLAETFPRLHLVMEHITTAAAVTLLDRYDNLSATVTLHHLLLTLDDVVGGLMRPHHFCKPIAKRPQDRDALRQAVFNSHPRLLFGSDSAPHPLHAKECCGCAAGIFTAPLALPALATIFAEAGCLERLQAFVSDHACRRYRISPPGKEVVLVDKPWRVPETYGEVRPFLAGTELPWSVLAVSVQGARIEGLGAGEAEHG